jgi:hypothetical protein
MNLQKSDFLWIIPSALVLGAGLSSLQSGNWWIGFASFSFLFLLSFTILQFAYRWLNGRKTVGLILSIAFAIRLLFGVSLYVFLPIHGHDNADNRAGYAFTDSHRRDDQAWELAGSDSPILNAFSQKFAYDQYGGLLAFSAFVYRYFSPDAHRPLMLVLLSAFVGALGVPFLWRAAREVFDEKVAFVSAWIFALYPESILLGSSAMREPYLLMFSAMALWGFVEWRASTARGFDTSEENARSTQPASLNTWMWLALGLFGMLLVSPAVALATLIIFAGWIFFTKENRSISWRAILLFAVVFFIGLFFLSASLNRSGQFEAASPLRVINDWLRLAVQWDAYQLERGSGWVQKLFDEMPEWVRLPFVAVYGILQPVLPATFITPTKLLWKIIYILRSLGWYAMLPMLLLSFMAGSASGFVKRRTLIQWLSLLAWTWILLAALRGGGDMWDNPRYRTILLVWQSLLAGVAWVWWRETRNAWFARALACEIVFLAVFTQWYASRYYHWGGQLPFAGMVALIAGSWVVILGAGWWRDRRRAA